MFVDTHAHIYTEEFSSDLDIVLTHAKEIGITKIFMPNIDSTTISSMLSLAEKYTFCHPMIGLHPCHVNEKYKEELKIVEKYLSAIDFSAIGEVGIDLFWDKTYISEQENAFRYQIALARDNDLPFVIHSRDSLDITIKIVEEMQDGRLSGIFHCFGGSLAQANKIIDLGFMLGIGGVLTYKNSGLDKVITNVPLSSLVLETDSPYLSPVPHRGKRNEPGYIIKVAEKLSEIKNLPLSEIAMRTKSNAQKIFKNIQF
ncbi:MAG: TatD family hydrolase [Saprospiraceae bacterium]|nr:TatD family hydrolase [Saprospiraceae bacterium]